MEGLSEGWLQFLFVAVPVLSLVGAWMGLRTAGRLAERRRTGDGEGALSGNDKEGEHERSDRSMD